MYKMGKISVDEQAARSFFTLFGSLVEAQVSSYYNPDFTIHYPPHSYSFAFLNNSIVICDIEQNRILDIKSFNYTDFIPDSFLNALLSMEQLPSRVKRYRKIGVDRLRSELVDELRLGAITAQDSTATWNDYDLKFYISPALQMNRIVS